MIGYSAREIELQNKIKVLNNNTKSLSSSIEILNREIARGHEIIEIQLSDAVRNNSDPTITQMSIPEIREFLDEIKEKSSTLNMLIITKRTSNIELLNLFTDFFNERFNTVHQNTINFKNINLKTIDDDLLQQESDKLKKQIKYLDDFLTNYLDYINNDTEFREDFPGWIYPEAKLAKFISDEREKDIQTGRKLYTELQELQKLYYKFEAERIRRTKANNEEQKGDNVRQERVGTLKNIILSIAKFFAATFIAIYNFFRPKEVDRAERVTLLNMANSPRAEFYGTTANLMPTLQAKEVKKPQKVKKEQPVLAIEKPKKGKEEVEDILEKPATKAMRR